VGRTSAQGRGRTWRTSKTAAPNGSLKPSRDFLDKLLDTVPEGIRQSLKTITPNFFGSKSGVPGYFDVLSTSIDIMTNQILRSRMAGEPPHVMISPRLSHMPVLEFNRAKEAVEEGRRSTQLAMPLLREYLG
jgi:NTE family protein